MALVGFLVFALALVAAVGIIAAMVLPQWQRIASLAAGKLEPEFQPLAVLVRAERRIDRRRLLAPSPTPRTSMRAAA